MSDNSYSDSNALAESTSGLSGFLRTLRRQKWPALATVITVIAGTIAYTANSPRIYESQMSVLLDNKTAVPVVQLAQNSSDGESGITSKDLSTEIQILRSLPLLQTAISKLPPADAQLKPESIAASLSVYQVQQTGVLGISYRDTDATRAQRILQALGETYVEYSLQNRRSQATNAIRFIEKRLPESRRNLNRLALDLKDFRQKNKIVDPDSYAASLVATKSGLERQVEALRISLAKATKISQERQRQLGGENADQALNAAVLSEDQNYRDLSNQYNQALSAYVLERARFTEQHPTVIALKQRRERLSQLLQQRVRQILRGRAASADVKALTPETLPQYQTMQQSIATQLVDSQVNLEAQQVELQGLLLAQRKVEADFVHLSDLQLAYTNLQRQLGIDSTNLNFLLQKLEELKVIEAQETSPWKVLNPPFLPAEPILPNTSRNLTLGALSAVMLAIGIALLLARLDQRVGDVSELREIIRLPLLGSIPRIRSTALNTLGSNSTEQRIAAPQLFREAMRSLVFNLRYLGPDQSVRVIAVVSSIPSEGKSTVAFNLAATMAEAGYRVLLIDADLRKPVIHRFIDVVNNDGLSSAISTGQPWSELVFRSGITNLDVLVSGPLPPDPPALLDSQKMSDMLEDMRLTYQYIILDTPPVAALADAKTLISKVDTTVLVVGIGRALRSPLLRSLELLLSTRGCKIAGMIANFTDPKNDDYYFKYFSSYYGTSTKAKTGQSAQKSLLSGFMRNREP